MRRLVDCLMGWIMSTLVLMVPMALQVFLFCNLKRRKAKELRAKLIWLISCVFLVLREIIILIYLIFNVKVI